jgi:polyferredoxin
MKYSERHCGPRSTLEAWLVAAFLAAWLLVLGLVLGQALLHHGSQIILALRGRI